MAIYNNITELIGRTPIVKLNNIVPEGAADVYVKLEAFNPGSSVKDRIALSMIEKAEYVAYNFTQYRELVLDKRGNKAVLDLSDQPIGMYVVIFYLTTGEKLTYKILKQ